MEGKKWTEKEASASKGMHDKHNRHTPNEKYNKQNHQKQNELHGQEHLAIKKLQKLQ